MDVLYSLLGVDNQRLDMIVQEKIFTETLNFVLTTSLDDILSIEDSMLDRFCTNILPRIDHNIKSLILESKSMERILLVTDYPNLAKLKIFNFIDKIASYYFTVGFFYLDQSPFRRIFREQITDLILVYKDDIDITLERQYQNGVHDYIFKFFKNLKYLSITGSPSIFMLGNSSLITTCSSSILSKLCVFANGFEECFALLDGRLKQLTTFIVTINYACYDSSFVYNMDDLPNLNCFSLTCFCLTNEYDTLVLPLLRRMSNLEELTLNITNEERNTFMDGTQLNNEIIVHMPRLSKFTFHICTKIELHHLVNYLSSDDIQRTFTNTRYQQMGCILSYTAGRAICHVFSLPYMFDRLNYIGNNFLPIVFTHVRRLTVHDKVPFQHEFFVRIARFFPLLKVFHVLNFQSQKVVSDKRNSTDNELFSIVEYPHLVTLSLFLSHIDYVEQFLNETKTHLPCLTTLEVNYDRLTIVTENFTRNITRLNCAKVEQLCIRTIIVHSKDVYEYFPLL
ncbi:unnamed protein product [Rotaria sordida]|uniref:Uncharacterized protein n=1 Tax=Rotaria sordida TaxID=392033 RepID=A0A819QT56_9BILA|nr:unnamed protein product [Rotaria sordida]